MIKLSTIDALRTKKVWERRDLNGNDFGPLVETLWLTPAGEWLRMIESDRHESLEPYTNREALLFLRQYHRDEEIAEYFGKKWVGIPMGEIPGDVRLFDYK